VADDDGAAGEVLQRVFQRGQRFGVEVVGRFVEQQHVAAGLQHLGEVHAVALAAGEVADLLLLVAAAEVEGRAVGARVHLVLAELDDLGAAGDFLPDGLVGVERVAALVDIAELHALADADRAGIRLSWPVIMRNSVVLPAPFGPMMPTMPPGGSLKDRLSISSRSP
jgi:hypothetical protein